MWHYFIGAKCNFQSWQLVNINFQSFTSIARKHIRNNFFARYIKTKNKQKRQNFLETTITDSRIFCFIVSNLISIQHVPPNISFALTLTNNQWFSLTLKKKRLKDYRTRIRGDLNAYSRSVELDTHHCLHSIKDHSIHNIARFFPCISQSAKPCYLNILSNLSSISPLIVSGMCEKSQKIFSRMSRNACHRKQANFFRQIDKWANEANRDARNMTRIARLEPIHDI